MDDVTTSENSRGDSSHYSNYASVPSNYKPLFPSTSSLSTPCVVKEDEVGPAASETTDSFDSRQNKTEKPHNWLKLSSITTDELIHDLKTFEKAEKSVNDNDVDVASTTSTKVKKTSHSTRKVDKKKKRKRSPSPEVLKRNIEKELIAQNSKKVFIEDVGLGAEHAFRVDRKSEQTNLAFNSFNPTHTAKLLNEVKFKPPMGLTPIEEKEWLSGKVGKKKKRRDRYAHRYCSRDNISVLLNEDGVLDLSKDRLKFGKGKFQEAPTLLEEFFPIIVKAQQEKKDKNNEDDDTDEDLKETTTKFVTRKTSEYNQYLRENPNDEAKWMEFIKFQDNAIEISFNDQTNRKMSEKAIFERKLSILDKALQSNLASVALHLAKMKLCEKYWELAELKKEWRKILFAHPNSITVWEYYLLFLQSHFSSFSFTAVVKGYAKCFEKLNSLLEGTFISHSPPPDLENHMLRIFLKFCQFLHQVGHREKALACFQAMFEFNCFTPKNLKLEMNLADWLAFFEPFWDGNVPRFGEQNAPGWATVMENKTLPENSNIETKIDDSLEDSVIQMKLNRHETWCKLERMREEMQWLPWKPNIEQTEDDCEDPDRMVVVDDVSPFLFRLKTTEIKFQLVRTFFLYLGMRVDPHLQSTCRVLDCHSPHIIQNPSTLMCCQKHFQYKYEKSAILPNIMIEEISDLYNTNYTTFIDRAIEKCVSLFEEPYKTEIQVYWLHLKRVNLQYVLTLDAKRHKKFLKEVRKFFKTTLKEETNRNKLVLWLEFVQLELDNGQVEEAKKMIDMIVTTQSKNVFDSNDSVMCCFYKLYAEIELTQSVNNTKCLMVLTSLVTGESISSVAQHSATLILKAKKLFQNCTDSAWDRYEKCMGSAENSKITVSSLTKNFLVDWVSCHAMFLYIHSDVQAAIILFERLIEKLNCLQKKLVETTSVRLDMERMYFSYLKLLLHHVNTTTASLKIIRTVLQRALVLYPQNVYFLQLLLDVESRSHIAGRLRRHFTKSMKLNCHPAVCFYAVLSEMSRLQSLAPVKKMHSIEFDNSDSETGISQKIRSYFEQALTCDECIHCPLLWRLYLKFELESGNIKQAKSVMYRALQQCVWNKKLYMDSTHIPECLQEILDIMTEKEIRTRIPIEEVDLLTKAAEQENEQVTDLPVDTVME